MDWNMTVLVVVLLAISGVILYMLTSGAPIDLWIIIPCSIALGILAVIMGYIMPGILLYRFAPKNGMFPMKTENREFTELLDKLKVESGSQIISYRNTSKIITNGDILMCRCNIIDSHSGGNVVYTSVLSTFKANTGGSAYVVKMKGIGAKATSLFKGFAFGSLLGKRYGDTLNTNHRAKAELENILSESKLKEHVEARVCNGWIVLTIIITNVFSINMKEIKELYEVTNRIKEKAVEW